MTNLERIHQALCKIASTGTEATRDALTAFDLIQGEVQRAIDTRNRAQQASSEIALERQALRQELAAKVAELARFQAELTARGARILRLQEELAERTRVARANLCRGSITT